MNNLELDRIVRNFLFIDKKQLPTALNIALQQYSKEDYTEILNKLQQELDKRNG